MNLIIDYGYLNGVVKAHMRQNKGSNLQDAWIDQSFHHKVFVIDIR